MRRPRARPQKDDLARMYRLFLRIVKGLDPVADVFKKHVEGEGMKLVREVTEAADAKKEKDVGARALHPTLAPGFGIQWCAGRPRPPTPSGRRDVGARVFAAPVASASSAAGRRRAIGFHWGRAGSPARTRA